MARLARARNTDMEFSQTEDQLLSRGKAPVLLEPVKATITVRKPGNPKAILLEHHGHQTDKTLPVTNGGFAIDDARDRTPYYLVAVERKPLRRKGYTP